MGPLAAAGRAQLRDGSGSSSVSRLRGRLRERRTIQTCLHLSGAVEPLLIDCGASSLIAMKRAGLNPSDIGCVLLTHFHGDHFGGLPFLILDGQFSRHTRLLVVGGPPGMRERVETFVPIWVGG